MAKFSLTPDRRVTEQDIADAVGVSLLTVGHDLHRSHRSGVSLEMQQEIFRVAPEMGCQPRDVSTHTLADVVLPESLWFDVSTNVLTCADKILSDHDYHIHELE